MKDAGEQDDDDMRTFLSLLQDTTRLRPAQRDAILNGMRCYIAILEGDLYHSGRFAADVIRLPFPGKG
jgi:hypothetical protein